MDSNRGAQDLRIVLVGITGAGKSASANTILGRKAFESKLSAASLTVECEKVSTQFEGQTLYVVDTPGLHDTNLPQEQAMSEIARCISFAAPGPHVFLVVIKPTKFTKEQKETVRIIQDLFGEEAERYTMVLFTCGDDLEVDEITIEQFFESNKALNDFVQQCKGGYHVFNNRNKDCSQVRELLKKINRMIWRNGGRYYTNKMLEEAERAIEAKKERLQRENESLTAKEARALAEKFNEFIQVVKIFYEAGRADRAAADRAAAEDAARRAAADRAAAVDAARRAAADRAAAEAAAHRAAAGAAALRGAAGAHFGATVGSAVGGLVDSATKNCIIQ